jgi:hypothetical protein
MRSEEEIRENIEDWREIERVAVEHGNESVATRAGTVARQLEWVLEDD